MIDELTLLQRWYADHCDGDWEHGDGVIIRTLDNPGWSVVVSIDETELADVPFSIREENYEHETDWVRCWVADGKFHGVGGARKLSRLLGIFLEWAAEHSGSGDAAV